MTERARAGRRILVVADYFPLTKLLSFSLTNAGYLVSTAGDGREALVSLRAQDYDVVVTNNEMPVMGGQELAAAIKAVTPRVPIILMTGNAGLLAQAARPAGVDFLIQKPFSMDELCALVASALDGAPP